MTGPVKLAPIHVQMLDFIMANPTVNYTDVAAHFGYTIGWTSQIINSDAFQALLAERQIECFGDIRLTIKDRVVGLAHESLRRLSEKLPTEADTSKVVNAADLALKALGFGMQKGPAPTVAQQNNTLIVGTVDPATLAAARELMSKRRPPEDPLPMEALPAPQNL